MGIHNTLFVSGNIITSGSVVAEQYIVNSSVTNLTQSFSSGSTIFGDTTDDTHQFTGSLSVRPPANGGLDIFSDSDGGSAKLNIKGRAGYRSQFTLDAPTSGHGDIFFKRDGDNRFNINYGYTSNELSLTATGGGATTSAIVVDTSGNLTFGGTSISGSSTSTGSFGKLYIDKKIGVGTLEPSSNNIHIYEGGTANARMQVEANHTSFESSYNLRTNNADGQIALDYVSSNRGQLNFKVDNDIASSMSTLMSLLHTGHVEFPAANQKISGSSTSTGSFGNLTVANDLMMPNGRVLNWGTSHGTLGSAIVGNSSTNVLVFYTNGSERARFDSSGNLIIKGQTDNIIHNGTSDASDSKSIRLDGGGGGGGASTPGGGNQNGGSGGSGIVIVRYLGTPIATGGTITQNGGYTIHSFTQVGNSNFTFQSASGTGTSTTSVDEEVAVGTLVANLTATDSDTTSFTFSLVSGNGSNDQHNSSFTISGTQLLVGGNIDYETTPSLNIYVQASDGTNTFSKALTVNVNDINEPPTISSSSIASDNTSVSVIFSEAVFGGTAQSTATLAANDFSLALTGGTATLSSTTPSSISVNGTTVQLGLPLSGTPNGSEVITISPVSNAIFDVQGLTASSTQSNNTVNANADSDGDGITDPLDLCSGTPQGATVDSEGCAESQKDPDNDGVFAANDNCPTVANPDQADNDQDGVGNVCDNCVNQNNPFQVDTDADGYGDVCDDFPNDASENADSDGDGIGDNADTDDDNDQYLDQDEIDCLTDPFDRTSTPEDFDKDLIPDCIDPNDDNDSCPDTEDEFPLDPEFCQDTDGDGIDDRFDFDSDNDGIPDHRDQFPQDPNANADSDGDGIPDSQDTDKNNDGFPDDQIIVSSALTPNQPGVEATWKVINIEDYPFTSVRVYAPDGSTVFQSENYQNEWTGTNIRTGSALPTGPYYYRIELGGTSGEIIDGWLYVFN